MSSRIGPGWDIPETDGVVEGGPGDPWTRRPRDVAVLEDVHLVAAGQGCAARARGRLRLAARSIVAVDGRSAPSSRRPGGKISMIVAGSHLALVHHARVHPAVGWMVVDGDPAELALAEVGLWVSQGMAETGQLEQSAVADARAVPTGSNDHSMPSWSGSRRRCPGRPGGPRPAAARWTRSSRGTPRDAVRRARSSRCARRPPRRATLPTPGRPAAWERRRRHAHLDDATVAHPAMLLPLGGPSGGHPWQTPRPWLGSRWLS